MVVIIKEKENLVFCLFIDLFIYYPLSVSVLLYNQFDIQTHWIVQKEGEKQECMKDKGRNSNYHYYYDKEKYREMILDAAETGLGCFGFDRASYSNHKVGRKWRWYEELREQRTRDIENEML